MPTLSELITQQQPIVATTPAEAPPAAAGTLGAIKQQSNTAIPQEQPPGILESFMHGFNSGDMPEESDIRSNSQVPSQTKVPERTDIKMTPQGGAAEQVGEAVKQPLTYAFGPGPAAAGLVGSAVHGATGNPWLGLLAGVGAGFGGNLVQKGLNMGKDAFTQANTRLGLPGATAAESSESPFITRLQGTLAGSSGGTNKLANAAEQRSGTAENVVTGLSPNAASNPAEAGQVVQAGATARQTALKDQNTNLIDKLDTVRARDDVDTNPYAVSLNSILGEVSPQGQSVVSPAQSSFIQRLQDGLLESQKKFPGSAGTLPYNDMKVLRTQIGNQLESAIMRGDGTTTGQLKQIYRGISASMRGAYDPMGQAAFDAVNAQITRNFNELEAVVTPLMRDGITPEKIFQWTGNEAKLGASKLVQVRNTIGDQAWNVYAGTVLRQLGRDADGNFNLATYATKWNQLTKNDPSQSTAKALFSNTPYADLPQAYQDLALVANRYKGANINYNRSESGNAINLANKFERVIDGLSKAAVSAVSGIGSGLSAYGATGNMEATAGATGLGALAGWGLGEAGGAIIQHHAEKALAALVTSPTFVKWAAVEIPVKAFPAYATKLVTAIDATDPTLSGPARLFIHYVNNTQQQPQLQQGEKGRGYLGGGEVTWPDQSGNTGYDEGGLVSGLKKPESKLFDKEQPHPEQVDPNQLGNTKNFKTPEHVPDYFIDEDKSIQNGTQEKNYMNGGYTVGPNAGGPGAQQMPNNQYAEGGAVGDDYNTKLSPDEEKQFQIWKAQNAPKDSGADYDLRGAYKAQLEKSDNGHWEDTFKKPNHPIFSEESQYSKQHPELPAGHWNNDDFIPPAQYNEGGISQRNFALGGLTDTKNPADYPPGYAQGGSVLQHFIGGGSVYSTENATPFAQGGMSNLSQQYASQDKSPSFTEDKYIEKQPSETNDRNIRNPAANSILHMMGITDEKEFAQGGISHNTNDPRPFYNPQLPGVTGGGWAGGGPIPPHMPQGMEDPSIIAPAPREKDYPQGDEFGSIPEHGSALSILDKFMNDRALHLWGGGGVPNEKLTSGTEIGT